jgi:hypothetical protein
MQALALVGLLFGVVPVVEVATLKVYLLSAALIVTADVSATAGAFLIRGHYMGTTSDARTIYSSYLGRS